MIGLFVGTFQPFHSGHLETVKYILDECELVKIVIGSSQYHHTENNPFTLEERTEMMELALEEEGVRNYELYDLEDVHNLPKWADLINERFQPVDLVYTRNQKVSEILKQRGIETKQQPQFGTVSGTEIRERIAAKDDWENLLPQSISAYLRKLDVEERFQNLNPPNPTC